MSPLPRTYQLKSSKRSTTLRISINNRGEVIVTKPWLMPAFLVDQFVKKHQDWIAKKLSEVHYKKNGNSSENSILYLGKHYKVEIKRGMLSLIFRNDTLTITAISELVAKRALNNWLKDKAKTSIVDAVKLHSNHMGLSYNNIRIKDQSSRWGSCSSKKNLNFNWRLIMAPPAVLHYVVIHELAHIKHMDHSRAFWQFVETYSPEYREHRRWLKRHQHQLSNLC